MVTLLERILNMFSPRRRRMERDLDRELRYHLDRRADDFRQQGLSDAEARRAASIEFGGVAQVREETRDIWIWRWLDDRVNDLRYAGRTLLRSPAFTLTTVLSLALGIGANTAIFSLVDQVLLRLLPVKEPERLVLIDWDGNQLADGWGSGNLLSYPLCQDLQAQDQFFDGVFCRHPTTVNLATSGEHEAVGAEIVSGSYFPVLGVQPALGRLIDVSDDRRPGEHPVVVVSHDYWQHRLGAAADVVGRKVLVNNFPMTLIGVAPAAFRGVDFGEVPAVWIPAAMKRQATPDWDRLLDRRARWMHVFGRLRPDMTAERAMAGLQPWFSAMLVQDTQREGFPRATPEQREQFLRSRIEITPAARGHSPLRNALDAPLRVLMAGTLLLLLLASLNVASLFIARGAARTREIRTRMALGASRSRIAGLLLADSLVIAIAGGVLGLLIAPAVSRGLIAFLPQNAAQVALTPDVNRRVLIFTSVVSLMTGIICGFAPAWQARRLPLIASLRDRSGTGAGGLRLRRALVIGQMAFTLILLIGAGLFVETLARLHAKGPGFDSAHLVTFQIRPARNGYAAEESGRIVRDVAARLRALPGVEEVGNASNDLLTGGSWNMWMTIDGAPPRVTDRLVHLNRVSSSFFDTLGARLLAGRHFMERDVLAAPGPDERYAIVNESFARRYYGNRSPLGRRLAFGDRPDAVASIEIVGVVEDFSYRNIREESEQVFFQFANGGTFYVRMRGQADSAFAAIRGAVKEVAPAVPVVALRTVEAQIDRTLTTERMLATLSSGFGAIALLLSVVGLYGVMAFVASARTQEIGIRLALGAGRASAVWLILRDAVIMIAAGAAIGLPCAWAFGRVIQSQLFGVDALDGRTIFIALAALGVVCLAAVTRPAWRAASISPMKALRFE